MATTQQRISRLSLIAPAGITLMKEDGLGMKNRRLFGLLSGKSRELEWALSVIVNSIRLLLAS
jgi:hypothetical protein